MLEKLLIICVAVLIQGCATTTKNMNGVHMQKTAVQDATAIQANKLYRD